MCYPTVTRRAATSTEQSAERADPRDQELELPDVVVVGDGSCWRQPAFCKQAVPLGDRGGRLVGEIQPEYDLATLPAAVRGLGGATEQRGVVRRVADPLAVDGDGVDVQVLLRTRRGTRVRRSAARLGDIRRGRERRPACRPRAPRSGG